MTRNSQFEAHKRSGEPSLVELVAMPLIGEGVAILSCLIPAVHYGDGMATAIAVSAALPIAVGVLLRLVSRRRAGRRRSPDAQSSYVAVVAIWLLLIVFGAVPFLLGGDASILAPHDSHHVAISLVDAVFESCSGLTSTGATIIPDVESLPPSLLLWRSLSQWLGGFGIVLLVLAVVPKLGINKHSLYTAEASGADNTGKTTTSVRATVLRTLFVYVFLSVIFIVLLRVVGLTLWEAVNLTFTNVSTGGFSIYSDSIASLSDAQQYILAVAMFLGGVNFALLFNLLTFRWRLLRRKFDQLGFYAMLVMVASAFVAGVLYFRQGLPLPQALRQGVVQTVSVVTTSGSVVADTNQWWTPVLFLFLVLCFCGGMAGSTTGGVKIMRVLILLRNVRNNLVNRIHPHAYNPVRLNGKPVSDAMITNVVVIFLLFAATIFVGFLALLVAGVDATEAIGAVFGCVTGYGPGLGRCGGFGSYAFFPSAAKLICSLLMLMGRLECITLLIPILIPLNRRWSKA